MKKINLMLIAAAALVCLTGCVKELIQETGALETTTDGDEVLICGSFEDSVIAEGEDAPETRTTVYNTKEVWWTYNDQIRVIPANTDKHEGFLFKSTLQNGQRSKTSYFTGSNKLTDDKYYVVYPAAQFEQYRTTPSIRIELPHNQKAVDNTFEPKCMPSYGSFTKNSKSFTMSPVYGGLKFSLSRDDIKSIRFEANNDQKISGFILVELDHSPIRISNYSSSDYTYVELTRDSQAGNFKSGTDYFIAMIPGTLSKGFTATLTTDAGKKLRVKVNKSIKIKAGVFGTLAKPLDEYCKPVHNYVDLGLSVKWATCNVGAESATQYGDYFTWGDPNPMPAGQQSDYLWSEDWPILLKYNYNSEYGTVDNKTHLDLKDDAAHVNWGNDWRIPTAAELKELLDNCDWVWTDDRNGTGVAGYVVTSQVSGYTTKSIFLPAAGHRVGTSEDVFDDGSRLSYWSSSLSYGGLPTYAADLLALKEYCQSSIATRSFGHSIRPVYGQWVSPTKLYLASSLTLHTGEEKTLGCGFDPSNVTDRSVRVVSSDPSVVKPEDSSSLTITAVAPGTATITVYACNGISASCQVTVITEPEYVDLGLSVKWATFNVGANAPEEAGDFFAWGEIAPKDSYSWSNYKWCNGTENTLTKYNTDSNYGTTDYKTVLDLEDDAAHVIWGSSWRLPTKSEFEELKNCCQFEWVDDYNGTGAKGYKVTSKEPGFTDNFIFLPAPTQPSGSNGYHYNGSYWASCGDYPLSSTQTVLGLYDHKWGLNSAVRYNHNIIRPVFGEFVPVSGISFEKGSLISSVGKVTFIPYTIQPSNPSYPRCTCSSSNPAVATCAMSGSTVGITGVAPGTATIKVYASNGLSASCVVTVENN